jgi:hypothetical protein
MTDWNRCGRNAGEFGAFSSFGAPCDVALCSQFPDARIVAAHSCWGDVLCSFSCNWGELAMVNAAKKAMTIPMPMKARGFMPAADLVAAGNPATEIRRSRELALQPASL